MPEYAHPVAFHSEFVAVHVQQCAFAKPRHHGALVQFQVFRDTRIPAFAAVAGIGCAFGVVRVDLERYKPMVRMVGTSVMGMSLVVMMVGQATLLPALQPK